MVKLTSLSGKITASAAAKRAGGRLRVLQYTSKHYLRRAAEIRYATLAGASGAAAKLFTKSPYVIFANIYLFGTRVK